MNDPAQEQTATQRFPTWVMPALMVVIKAFKALHVTTVTVTVTVLHLTVTVLHLTVTVLHLTVTVLHLTLPKGPSIEYPE